MAIKLKDNYDVVRKEIYIDVGYAPQYVWAVTVDNRELAWFRYRADANLFYNWCQKELTTDSSQDWKGGKSKSPYKDTRADTE